MIIGYRFFGQLDQRRHKCIICISVMCSIGISVVWSIGISVVWSIGVCTASLVDAGTP
jgi:hypothetical protein